MRVNNPDCSPFGIDGWDSAQTPTGLLVWSVMISRNSRAPNRASFAPPHGNAKADIIAAMARRNNG
jgi:hypothetical protein